MPFRMVLITAVTVEDKAGNTATSKPLPVVIDATAEIGKRALVTDSGDVMN